MNEGGGVLTKGLSSRGTTVSLLVIFKKNFFFNVICNKVIV